MRRRRNNVWVDRDRLKSRWVCVLVVWNVHWNGRQCSLDSKMINILQATYLHWLVPKLIGCKKITLTNTKWKVKTQLSITHQSTSSSRVPIPSLYPILPLSTSSARPISPTPLTPHPPITAYRIVTSWHIVSWKMRLPEANHKADSRSNHDSRNRRTQSFLSLIWATASVTDRSPYHA